MVGQTLGQYKIIRKIGAGATATVWLGEHLSMGRGAAVKILHPHLASDLRNIERLRREAQALSQLSHENIVRVYDFAAERDHCYVISEFVDGPSLKEWLQARADFPPELSVAVMIQVCRALAAAHALGIVHRDIKPENILLAAGGVVKLTDFGIARLVELDKMTVTGALLGSPNYMSPEQVECAETGPASDLFSAGVLFYHLLTRALPFDGPTSARVFRNISDCRYLPADAVNRRAGRLMAALVDGCLRINPAERPSSAQALLIEFERLSGAFGLGDPQIELGRFIASPEDYLKDFDGRMVKALLAFARERRKAKDGPSAMAAVSQALYLEPANREARAFLKNSRIKKRLLVLSVALVSGVLAVSAGVQWLGYMRSRPVPAPAEIREAPVLPPVPSAGATGSPVKTDPPVTVRARPRPAGVKTVNTVPETAFPVQVAPVAVRYGQLKIFTKPWAKVYLDGEYKGKTPFQGEWVVTGGTHVLRLENPFCPVMLDTLEVPADSVMEKRYTLTENAVQ